MRAKAIEHAGGAGGANGSGDRRSEAGGVSG
jgi:hypothetical protein